MPSNKLTITISAVDKVTKTVNDINKKWANMLMPVTKLKRSLGNLGNALGLPKIQKKISGVAKAAGHMAEQIGKVVAPMAALIGVGTIGGIAALATEWAKLGFEITNTAATLGLSTTQLQSLRGAAALAGVSSGELDSSLKALGDTMEDALYGRNQSALMMMNRLGIQLHRTATGAVDTADAMMQVSRAITAPNVRGNAQVQSLIARQFGLEALLPLLRKGPQAIAEYQAKVRELGGEMSGPAVEAAAALEEKMLYLHAAIGGLKNSIGSALIPVLSPLIEGLTDWISRNRELIASKVAEYAQEFATWVKSVDWKEVVNGITAFVKQTEQLVEKLGGVKAIAIGVGLALTASVLAPVLSLVAAMASLSGGIATVATGLAGLIGLSTLAAGGLVGAAGATGVGLGMLFNSWYGKESHGSSLGSDLYNTPNHGSLGGVDQTGSTPRVVSYFMSKGWSREQAIGIAANLKEESGYNTSALGDGGKAYGIAQWHKDRQEAFEKWSGKNIHDSTLEDQMGFVNYELTQGGEARAGAMLRGASSAGDAAAVVSRYYERPGAADEAAAHRADTASQMSLGLDVHVHGLPPGAGVTVTPKNNSAADQTPPVKVTSSMPSFAV